MSLKHPDQWSLSWIPDMRRRTRESKHGLMSSKTGSQDPLSLADLEQVLSAVVTKSVETVRSDLIIGASMFVVIKRNI